MWSSPEPRHAAVVEPLLRAALTRRRAAVVLIDGRSGSGKSTFAAALAAQAGARLLRLEDVYPGWDGLDAAVASLVADVLVPRRAGLPGRIAGWDWTAGCPTPGAVVPPDAPLVVEGCGAAVAARFADVSVWVELEPGERRRRALARDGVLYEPFWDRWAQQEARIIARAAPRRSADLVVDGRSIRLPAHSAPTADAH